MKTPHPSDLAREFSRRLREEIGDTIHEVIDLNASEANPNVCHSHDFCDANVTMLEAFVALAGFTPDVNSDAFCHAVNAAWAIAKANEFETDTVSDGERSNGPRR